MFIKSVYKKSMTQIRNRIGLHSFLLYLLLLFLFQNGAFAQQIEEKQELKELSGYKYQHLVINADTSAADIPVIIGLHWSGSTANEFAQYLTGFTKPVRLILVQAPYPHKSGFSFFSRQPKDYYKLPVDEKMTVLLQEGEKLSKFIEAVTKLYKPGKKPVIIGASQGGDLSYVIGIRYSHLISQSCPLLATMDDRIILPLTGSSENLVPIDVFHGAATQLSTSIPSNSTLSC